MKLKNIFIVIVLSFTGFVSFGQTGKTFDLKGRIENPNLDSVSFLYIDYQGKVNRQVVSAENGNFLISGTISQPTMAYLLFIHKGENLAREDIEKRTIKVFIEPAEMFLNEEADANGNVHIKGSASQDEWNDLRRKTRKIQHSLDSLKAGDKGADRDNMKVVSLLKSEIAGINYDYFIRHPESYVSANQVMFYTSVFSLDSLQALYNNYSPEIKESIDGRRLASEIKSRTAGLPGTMAFEFSVKDKDNKDLSLSDFKGKYVLLDFWATWCIPCRQSMPHMIDLYRKYKDRGFDIIAIGDDDSRVKEWNDAIKHDSIEMFHHILRGVNTDLKRRGIPNPRDLDEGYGIRALPTLILVDPEGKIIGRYGDDKSELDKILAKLFK